MQSMPSTEQMTKGLKALTNYNIVQRHVMVSVLIQKWPSTDSLSNQTIPYLHVQIHLLVHAQVGFCLSSSTMLSKLILFPLDSACVFQLP